MTRFRSKILWYWDKNDFNMFVVLVFRSYNNPWDITLYFGTEKCIILSSLGEVVFDKKLSYESKKCNSQSWHEILYRYFPKDKYVKSGELYVYDIPNSLE